MTHHADLLYRFKARRRELVDQLAFDEHDTAAELVTLHVVVTAIEAVMTEPAETPAGPKVAYGVDGWPI